MKFFYVSFISPFSALYFTSQRSVTSLVKFMVFKNISIMFSNMNTLMHVPIDNIEVFLFLHRLTNTYYPLLGNSHSYSMTQIYSWAKFHLFGGSAIGFSTLVSSELASPKWNSFTSSHYSFLASTANARDHLWPLTSMTRLYRVCASIKSQKMFTVTELRDSTAILIQ